MQIQRRGDPVNVHWLTQLTLQSPFDQISDAIIWMGQLSDLFCSPTSAMVPYVLWKPQWAAISSICIRACLPLLCLIQ